MRKTEMLLIPVSMAAILWMVLTLLRMGNEPATTPVTIGVFLCLGFVVASIIFFILAFKPPRQKI